MWTRPSWLPARTRYKQSRKSTCAPHFFFFVAFFCISLMLVASNFRYAEYTDPIRIGTDNANYGSGCSC